MQISHYTHSQYYSPKNKTTSTSPNFKAIIIEPNIKSNIRSIYHPVIDHLEDVWVKKLANFKFWDLKVIACASSPLFILQSKKHRNGYSILPEKISEPVELKDSGKSAIPVSMFIPRAVSESSFGTLFETKILSNKDEAVRDRRQTVYLQYDDMNDADKAYSSMCELQNQYERNLHGRFNYLYYVNYPLYILHHFENAYQNRGDIDEDISLHMERDFEHPQKSHIVHKSDKEVVEGKKTVDSSDKKLGFAKVAGMTELKETLKEDVILPLQQVELYKQYGIEPINGMLLYGPPGTGKTFIAEALAEECGRTFLKMDVAETESKWVGETPKNIAKAFKEAEQNAPSVIFIDEIEALAPSRGNLDNSSSAAIGHNQAVNTLLQQINNCSERGIFVIAATNEPQKVDSALRRAGRMDKNIFVGPPDKDARRELFKMNLENIYAEKDIDYDKLASLTENYTAPEIKQIIIRQAALKALKQNRRITEGDVVEVIQKYKPQLDTAIVELYRKNGEMNNNVATQKRPLRKIGFTECK